MRWFDILRHRHPESSVYEERGIVVLDGLGQGSNGWLSVAARPAPAPELADPLHCMHGPARPGTPLADIRQYVEFVGQEPADEQQEQWFGHVKPLWKVM